MTKGGRQKEKDGEREGETLTCSERGGSVCLLLCSTWIHPFLSAFSLTLPRSRSLSLSCSHSHSFHPFLFRLLAFSPSLFLSPSITPLTFLTFIQLGLLCTFLSFLFWLRYFILLSIWLVKKKKSKNVLKDVGLTKLRKRCHLSGSNLWLFSSISPGLCWFHSILNGVQAACWRSLEFLFFKPLLEKRKFARRPN